MSLDIYVSYVQINKSFCTHVSLAAANRGSIKQGSKSCLIFWKVKSQRSSMGNDKEI